MTGQVGPSGVPISVLAATIELTDAQVKTLPTTSVVIVTAPGARKIIMPFYGVVRLTWIADYGNIDASAQIVFQIGPGGNVLLPFRQDVQSSVSGLLAGGGPDGTIGWTPTRFLGLVSSTPSAPLLSGVGQFYDSDLVDLPLTISADNGSAGNFIGGDNGNSLLVTVLYTVIDT